MKAGVAYRSKRIDERGIVYTNRLLEVVTGSPLVTYEPAWGDGTLDNPYKPTMALHWAWLASRASGNDPMFIEVGERTIARWGAFAGGKRDYATDITDYKAFVRDKIVGREKQGPAINEIAKDFELRDAELEKRFGHDGLSVYSRKALRIRDMSDAYAAAKSRQLLQGIGDAHGCPELANTLVALLVCEAFRSRPTFAVSLMLLDLVETSTTYGRGGLKTYTWKSMLMHHVDRQDFPIAGRGPGAKLPLAKHPMAGFGTAKLGKNINYGVPNMVVDRIVSVTSAWLAHYLARRHTDWTFFLVKEGKLGQQDKLQKKGWKDANEGWLQRLCGSAIGIRLVTLDLLIGGTTVYYEDLDGNPV